MRWQVPPLFDLENSFFSLRVQAIGKYLRALVWGVLLISCDFSCDSDFKNELLRGKDRSASHPAVWQFEAYFKTPNASGGDMTSMLPYLTALVALDGDTLVVAAHREDSNTNTVINGTNLAPPLTNDTGADRGAVYVFRRSGSTWAFEAYLKAPNSDQNDFFGSSVAVSGDTIVVGAVFEDHDGTTVINFPTALVTNENTGSSGAAYVFQRTAGTWAYKAYLKPPNPGTNDIFGWAVAVSGDVIVVGARAEDSDGITAIDFTDGSPPANDNAGDSGAAYVYQRDGVGDWFYKAYLKAPNSRNPTQFGWAVAVSGDGIVVGAPGEASNTNAIVPDGGSFPVDNGAAGSGAAYVFRRATDGKWKHEAFIKAPNNAAGNSFGSSVAISGDTIAVGAPNEDSQTKAVVNGATGIPSDILSSNSGAAYVFDRAGVTWQHRAYLKAPNGAVNDVFGSAVAISGDAVVVGAYASNDASTAVIQGADLSATNQTGSDNGAAYIFRRSGGLWAHEAYLKAPNTSNNDQFGVSVAASADTVVILAQGEASDTKVILNRANLFYTTNDLATEAGAAYAFRLK